MFLYPTTRVIFLSQCLISVTLVTSKYLNSMPDKNKKDSLVNHLTKAILPLKFLTGRVSVARYYFKFGLVVILLIQDKPIAKFTIGVLDRCKVIKNYGVDGAFVISQPVYFIGSHRLH